MVAYARPLSIIELNGIKYPEQNIIINKNRVTYLFLEKYKNIVFFKNEFLK
jgi:hypothetical protein